MTQGEALTILKTGANVFLTGEPGSGKTHTVNSFISWLRDSGIEPSVTAATGIAATHVGGQTLHSWSGIGIADSLSPAEIDRIASREHVARRIIKAKILIIDEISMLSAGTFAMADAVCKEVRRSELPFGGLQVILVGDFFQLPPIAKMGRTTQFAYDSDTWRALNPIICYLSEQHRQEDDAFLSVLSAIRSGEVEEMHYEYLSERRLAPEEAPAGAPKLFSHNADVDRINTTELGKIPGKSHTFRMTSSGKDTLVDGLKRGCLSPEILELKEGAEVMFTKNSPQGKFVNGTLGFVDSFGADGVPIIETKDGERIAAEPMEWQVEQEGKVRASITQVPLRLAYAMTVHKSQGMSMDAAVMDLSQAFEYGQGYVALSRVRTLAGVYLLGINARALEVHPQILEKDKEFRDLSATAAHTFGDMPRDELEELQKNFVKALGGAWVEEGSTSTRKSKKVRPGIGMPPRLAETLTAVREARTLEGAAKDRGLAISTVIRHLEELSELGKLEEKDFKHLFPSSRDLEEMQEAWKEIGGEKLTPVFQALGGHHSFEHLRLARLTL